ncbi:MAG: copper homeostasis protein CutC [Chloroflexi bacterium]|nr:MAG: copper homeostasis protein CutC [Chloroflexota bacterium]
MITVEICITGIESALAAQAGGANRVELCENLADGGTTPSLGMMALVRENLSIDVNVMIRPRGGDFCYSAAEFEMMKKDIAVAKEVGVNGIVLGILNPNGTVDKERCRELIELARPLSVTCHRAFDMTRDPIEAIDDLLELGVDRLLTSGLEQRAPEGAEIIRQLQERAGDRIAIMAGSGVNHNNAIALIEETGVREIHVSSSVKAFVRGRMMYENPRVAMGDDDSVSEYAVFQVSPPRVEALVDLVKDY